MSKSYVTMIRRTCVVCDKEYDTNELALDKRLRDTFERYTNMGLGVCPDHMKDGYVVLIGIEPDKSNNDSVWRTGETVYIKREAFTKIFTQSSLDKHEEFKFIDTKAIRKLEEMEVQRERSEHAGEQSGDGQSGSNSCDAGADGQK